MVLNQGRLLQASDGLSDIRKLILNYGGENIKRSKIIRWGVTVIFTIYLVFFLLSLAFVQTGIDQDAYDKLTEEEQSAVERYYDLRTVITPATIIADILFLAAGFGLAILTGYLWMNKDSETEEVKKSREEYDRRDQSTENKEKKTRKIIKGLKEAKSELDERFENGEIDKDEYLRLKRKYDRRIEELEKP